MPTITPKKPAPSSAKRPREPRRRTAPQTRGKLPPALLLAGFALIAVALLIGILATRNRSTIVRRVEEYISPIPASHLSSEGFSVDSNGVVSYSYGGVTALQGIDVSSHQGDIDWSAVAADGIEFAIIRAGWRGYTEGGLFEDELFTYNLDSARANGIQVGVYFFSQAVTTEEAVAEAQLVLELLGDQPLDLPVYFDWEPYFQDAARTDGLDNDTLTACANAFCNTILAAGYQAGVYFNTSMAQDNYRLAELFQHDFWLAEIEDAPTFHYQFSLWQYTFSGSVDGIVTDVDRDLWFVSEE